MKGVDGVVFQNSHDQTEFSRRGLLRGKEVAKIVGSGFDTDIFNVPPSHDRNSVVFVGRFLEQKGILDFDAAVGNLRTKYDSIMFAVVGAAPGDHAIIKKLRNVEVFPHTSDMRGLLATVKILVLPTFYGEGVPRVLLEAAGAGCALIVSDHPSCLELVTHELDGLVVPQRDPQKLSDSIDRLLADPTLATSLALKAQLRAHKYFSSAAIAEQYIQFFNRLAS